MIARGSPALPGIAGRAERAQPERRRSRNVMVIDDNESQLKTLAALIGDEGFEVATSDDPRAALEALAGGEFGVAVVDLRMPALDGIQVLERIRQLPCTMHVIIHTAHGDFDSARDALNLGAFAFVEKLGDPAGLLAHIHRASRELLERYSDELAARVEDGTNRLIASEQRASTTLHSIAEGVITTDAQGRVDYMNPVAEALTGWSLVQARGLLLGQVFTIVDGVTREPVADPAERCLEVRRVIGPSRETILLSRDGTEHWIRGSAAPLRDAAGRIIGVVLTANDVTDRIRAEQEVHRYRDHLEDLVRERTAALRASLKELESFSYSVSHDLRSPLRSLDGYSQMLLEDYGDVLDENGRHSLRRVRAASQRMGKLIDDLLHLSRLTRRDLSRERVDVAALARDVARCIAEDQPQRRFEFSIGETHACLGDTALLRVALENLLSNAAKYSSRECVACIGLEEVAPPPGSDAGPERVFCVSDNGVGFDMQHAGKLFGAFQRLHAEPEFEGNGIGLATTARIIERHGGRIWAEGTPGEGARFFFALPCD